MIIENGFVTAIENGVGESTAQQAPDQTLRAQVRALELGGKAQAELPQVDVGERTPHGDARQRGAELVGFHRDCAAVEPAELLLGPVGEVAYLIDLRGIEPRGDRLVRVGRSRYLPMRQSPGDEAGQQLA